MTPRNSGEKTAGTPYAAVVRPAGAATSDEQFAAQVANQTDPNLKVEDVFEREADGTASEQTVVDADADELR